MSTRMFAVAVAAAAFWASAAGAQTGATGGAAGQGMSQSGRMSLDVNNLTPISEYDTPVTYNGRSVTDLKSSQVKGANDAAIGHVDKVLADASNTVVAVTVSAGDVPGTGSKEKEVVIPVDRLKYDDKTKTFTSSLSPDDLKSLPEWHR